MKLININMLLLTENEEQKNGNENNDTPNTSFDRVDLNN